jgi:hypothetical protein
MLLQSFCTLLLLPLFITTTLAVPVAGSSEPMSTPNSPILEARVTRGSCPKTSAENICTSGEPYCCVGSGKNQVCGKSQVQCSSTTICCNNFNGVSCYFKSQRPRAVLRS